jgi:hypothetical protein
MDKYFQKSEPYNKIAYLLHQFGIKLENSFKFKPVFQTTSFLGQNTDTTSNLHHAMVETRVRFDVPQ